MILTAEVIRMKGFYTLDGTAIRFLITLLIVLNDVDSDSDRVQQVLGFLFRQQPEASRGPQEDGRRPPPGGRDHGLGHLEKL